MSDERVILQASPGENIADTAARAINLASLTGLRVEMRHNDRVVNVHYNDTGEQVIAAWDRVGSDVQQKWATGGVWVAYHYDWSGVVVFADEIDCLRHAVSNSMATGWWPFGTERDAIEKRKAS